MVGCFESGPSLSEGAWAKYPRGNDDLAKGPISPPDLVCAVNEIEAVHKMAADAAEALADFIGRVSGIETRDEGNHTRPLFSDGVSGNLRRGIDNTREVVAGILEMTRTLRTIA